MLTIKYICFKVYLSKLMKNIMSEWIGISDKFNDTLPNFYKTIKAFSNIAHVNSL